MEPDWASRLKAGPGVLPLHRVREPHAGEPQRSIGLVTRLHHAEVRPQIVSTRLGEQGRTVLGALAPAHEEQALIEVDILDAQVTTLRDAQPAAVDDPAQEEDGAERLVLGAGRHPPVDRQMGQEVPHAVRPDARVGHPLLLGQVREEASHPVDVAAFGAMGVVPGAYAEPQLLERLQGAGSSLLVDDGIRGLPVPVRPLEEVDEVDAEGLLRLAYLPFLTTAARELLAEETDLVGQGPVRGRACQELAHPAHAVGRRPVLHQARPQDELAKLLQRRLHLPHGPPLPGAQAWEVPTSAEMRGRPQSPCLQGLAPTPAVCRTLRKGAPRQAALTRVSTD